MKCTNNGFTLVELVVVVSIIAILGLIFTDTLVQSLRGQNKSKLIAQVKQNGQVVLDRVSSEMRTAEKIVCVGKNTANISPTSNDDTVVAFKQGIYTRFRLIIPQTLVAPMVNGYITKEDFTIDDILLINQQGVENSNLLCTNPGEFNSLGSAGVTTLTDTDLIGGISINYLDISGASEPVFKRLSQAGYPDIVVIKFTASEAVSAGMFFEKTVKSGGVPFSTAVQIRGTK